MDNPETIIKTHFSNLGKVGGARRWQGISKKKRTAMMRETAIKGWKTRRRTDVSA